MGPVLPDDFGTAWVAVAPVPRGKRCLLVAYKSWAQGEGLLYVIVPVHLKRSGRLLRILKKVGV